MTDQKHNDPFRSKLDRLTEQQMQNYLAGNMSPEEMHEVEKLMLESDFEAEAMEGLEMLKDRDTLPDLHKQIDQLTSPQENKKKGLIIGLFSWKSGAIAAAIVLLIATIWVVQYQAIPDLPQPVSEQQPTPSTPTIPEPPKVIDSTQKTIKPESPPLTTKGQTVTPNDKVLKTPQPAIKESEVLADAVTEVAPETESEPSEAVKQPPTDSQVPTFNSNTLTDRAVVLDEEILSKNQFLIKANDEAKEVTQESLEGFTNRGARNSTSIVSSTAKKQKIRKRAKDEVTSRSTSVIPNPTFAWKEVNPKLPFSTNKPLQLLTFNQKLWVWQQGALWYSTNGKKWQQQSLPDSLRQVSTIYWTVYNNKLTGYSTQGYRFWSSSNGRDWKSSPIKAPVFIPDAMTAFKGRLWSTATKMAYNEFTPDFISSNGQTWAEMPTPPWSMRITPQITAFNQKLLVIGGTDYNQNPLQDIWITSDGKEWEQGVSLQPTDSFSITGTTVLDNRLWIIGQSPGQATDLFYTTNATRWTPALGAHPYLRILAITSFDNQLVLITQPTTGGALALWNFIPQP